ncbi:hypothetical protein J14TS2_41910 [Bacillus sp. J14TS2]|uniref:DUF1648 domain-containing protein n=1 Tax=Bacillus sp. J14TS2 TaxID=2807188 RepID=UPI001B0CDC6C|nr:DUF1648 domain-containing protein [Bacillus sp. J14TS2]GIN73716.1 hypothetical protein J14TS2_41910 [Bacillus sp. J14TS2]
MGKENRPKFTLPITKWEQALNIVTIIVFISTIVYLIYHWRLLPDQVPAHYNAAGVVDRWGSKGEMLILPIIGIVMWIGMTILERYPHAFNYMVPITMENASTQYKNARYMINVLKNGILLSFSFLTWEGIKIALNHQTGLGIWFPLIFLSFIFAAMIYFIIRSFRLRKKEKQ